MLLSLKLVHQDVREAVRKEAIRIIRQRQVEKGNRRSTPWHQALSGHDRLKIFDFATQMEADLGMNHTAALMIEL